MVPVVMRRRGNLFNVIYEVVVLPKRGRRLMGELCSGCLKSSSDAHHWGKPFGVEGSKHRHIESVDRWVGPVRHPQHSERSVQSDLHPPAPGHDLPDPLKNRALHQTWFKSACAG